MIDICFGHKIKHGVLFVNRLSIGHGLPQHGQLDFISLVIEEISLTTGEVVFASLRWGLGLWRLKRKMKPFLRKAK